MTGARLVVAGLAHVRAGWFTEVARWSTAGAVPFDFAKCLAPTELAGRLTSGAALSAVLLDGDLGAAADLVALGQRWGVPVILVTGAAGRDEWLERGAAAVLAPTFDRGELVAAVGIHGLGAPGRGVAGPDARRPASSDTSTSGVHRAPATPLVAVTGAPGTGRSTVAIAIAQGLADTRVARGGVLLADLAERAHQAILHDARDVVPGVAELLDASGPPSDDQEHVRALTFAAPSRGYRVLLGLRSAALAAGADREAAGDALTVLRGSCELVVADVDLEMPAAERAGSMSGAALRTADLVVVVARPSPTGLCDLVVALHALTPSPAIPPLVVLDCSPRRPRKRSELTRAVAELVRPRNPDAPEVPFSGVVHVPHRHDLDALHEVVARLPPAIVRPVASAVADLLCA